MTVIPVAYYDNFVLDSLAVEATLWADLAWERRDTTPRHEYYSNDFAFPYTYGTGKGVRTYDPKPWHPEVMKLRKKLEGLTGETYEVCFLNGYRDQSDHLGWHADDSPEMDDARCIGIISLGVTRAIGFAPKIVLTNEDGSVRYKPDKANEEQIPLKSGSLCVMAPGMQDTHMHRIPKSGIMCGTRISLTFRGYVQGAK